MHSPLPHGLQPQPRRRFMTFVGSGFTSHKQRQEDYLRSIPTCKACGNTQMEKLASERCWICAHCGRRIPIDLSSSSSSSAAAVTNNDSNKPSTLHVVGTQSRGGRSHPTFEQPKDLAARTWRQRENDKKRHLSKEDQDLMKSSPGINIISTTEIKTTRDVRNPKSAQ